MTYNENGRKWNTRLLALLMVINALSALTMLAVAVVVAVQGHVLATAGAALAAVWLVVLARMSHSQWRASRRGVR